MKKPNRNKLDQLTKEKQQLQANSQITNVDAYNINQRIAELKQGR